MRRGWTKLILGCQCRSPQGLSLPYASGAVSRISSPSVLQTLDGVQVLRLLHECYRVLREGGHIAVEVPELEWCCRHSARSLYIPKMPNPTGRPSHHNLKQGSAEHMLQNYMHQAGFEVIQTSRSTAHNHLNVVMVARKPRRLALAGVSLVAADSRYADRAVFAMQQCLSQCRFFNALLFTDTNVELPPEITRVQIPRLASRMAYSEFMIWHLPLYQDILGSHILIVQHDGYVLNAEAWRDAFLTYDYVGAPWVDGVVGNGGFSLRSKKLLRLLLTLKADITVAHPEDEVMGRQYRQCLESAGIRFAPAKLAAQFSVEGEAYQGSFGYHGTQTKRLSNTTAFNKPRDVLSYYNSALPQSAALGQHLETLRRLCRDCQHVTEYVSQAGSATPAFVVARPEVLVTYAPTAVPGFGGLQDAAAAAGVDMRVVWGELPGPEIAKTDLLFVSGHHTSDWLKRGLDQQTARAGRYLIFHEVRNHKEWTSDSQSQSLGVLVQEFLISHAEWRLLSEHGGTMYVLGRIGMPEEGLDTVLAQETLPEDQGECDHQPSTRSRIRYVVSSHVDYEYATLPVILPSLSSIEPSDILVVVGGATQAREEVRCGILFLYVEHNSFEWTGIIEIVERNLEANWWFWLHDTCECGPEFRQLAEGNFDPAADITAVHMDPEGPACSFGMYSYRLLMHHKDYLVGLKGLSEERVIYEGGSLYRSDYGTKAIYPDATRYSLGQLDVYNSGVTRRMEHYSAVDLYKYKVSEGEGLMEPLLGARRPEQ